MRFAILIKSTADTEAAKVPEDEVKAMYKYDDDLANAGVLLSAEGLHPSAKGSRLHFGPGDEVKIVKGPFSKTNELLCCFYLIQVKSKEEAVEWARRIPNQNGVQFEAEVRLVHEWEDCAPEGTDDMRAHEDKLRAKTEELAKAPAASQAPKKHKFMALIMGNADSEAGKLPSKELLSAMGKFNEEMVNAGMMLGGEGFHPSAKAIRVLFGPGDKVATEDGPLPSEQKVIAGYWLLQAESLEEVERWMSRVPRPPEESECGEIEIRPVFDCSRESHIKASESV